MSSDPSASGGLAGQGRQEAPAASTYPGIGGLLLVEDDEEAAPGLPAGEREIPLILQDRELNAAGQPVYVNPNEMAGRMGPCSSTPAVA